MKIHINNCEVKAALDIFKPNGELFEIRGVKGKENISGYFTNVNNAINALEDYNFRDTANWQIYFSLNRINPACFSREQCNKFISSSYGNKVITTSDGDIFDYEWILIDFDTERPSGTSSSDKELEKSHQVAVNVYQNLKEYGFSDPITALSGNGYHLLYKVNFKNNSENVQLVKDFLGTLNRLYSANMVKIDTTVYNPARICKLYGTIAAKGTPTAERPHRQAKILTVPSDLSETSRELLQKFVNEHEQQKEKTNNRRLPQRYSGTSFNLADWLSAYNVPIRSTETKNGDNYYILESCPFNPEHTGKDSAIIQKADGTLCFNCFHNSCSDKTWKDFRLFYEPTAYDKKNDGYKVSIGQKTADLEQSAADEKEYQDIIELAKANVLDRRIIDYMDNFTSVKELKVFGTEIMKYAKNQNVYDEFQDLMTDQKKEIAAKAKQRKKAEANANKAYNHDGTGKMTIENLAFYLEQNNVKIKYNIISHSMEIDGFASENQEQLTENAPALMEDDLKELIGNTQTRIASYLNVLAARNDYNPILDKINSTVWDGKTRLNDLFKLLGIDTNTEENKYNRIFLRKWLMQCICGLHNNMKKPFSLDIVLVFKGKQGIGKTRLLEALTLDSRYFGDGVVLDVRNKDDIMQSLSKWICELGEIGSTFKKDKDSLKAFISKSVDEFRVPYGKTAIKYPRMTSFCGTVNDDEFLIDTTGNRRFAVIPLNDDWYIDYKDIRNFDFLQLWAEINKCIENMVEDGEKSYSEIFRFNRSEIQELERRNGKFIKPVPAQRELEEILEMNNYQGIYPVEWKYTSVTEFAENWEMYLKKYSVQQIGTALNGLGYKLEIFYSNGQKKKLRKLPMINRTKTI